MKQNSKQIQKELEQTINRLGELTEMRQSLSDSLKNLQDAFVGSKTSLDAVQSEKGKLDALESSIKALEAKQTELETALTTAQDAETVGQGLVSLKTIAEQAEKAFSEYDGLRVELGGIIKNTVEKILGKSAEFYGKRKEFQALARQIEAKQPGIGISRELKQIGLDEKSYNSATTEFIQFTPCEFGESIVIAERIVTNENQRRQEAAMRAADAAELERIRQEQQAKRQEEAALKAKEIEADKQRIIQYRIDNELPALSEKALEDVVNELQQKKVYAAENPTAPRVVRATV